jgi:hypothetical protein
MAGGCDGASNAEERYDRRVMLSGLRAGRKGDSAMAKTYRDVATEEMLQTVEEAMRRVINYWGDLPPEMKEAVEQFRTQLEAAIDSVEFVRRALAREVHELERRLD